MLSDSMMTVKEVSLVALFCIQHCTVLPEQCSTSAKYLFVLIFIHLTLACLFPVVTHLSRWLRQVRTFYCTA